MRLATTLSVYLSVGQGGYPAGFINGRYGYRMVLMHIGMGRRNIILSGH